MADNTDIRIEELSDDELRQLTGEDEQAVVESAPEEPIAPPTAMPQGETLNQAIPKQNTGINGGDDLEGMSDAELRAIASTPTTRLEEAEGESGPLLRESLAGSFGDSRVGKALESEIVDGILAPMTELSRGLLKGGASFYEKLDGVTKLLENASGGRIDRSGTFGDYAADLRRYANEELPRTGMNKAIKTVYEMVGATTPIMTEFALADKALTVTGLPIATAKAGMSQLNETSKWALLGALDAYEKDPEFESLVEGGVRGANTQMTFAIAALGGQLIKKGYTKSAEKFVEWTTNNKDLAKAFVKNPKDFILSPFKSIKNVKTARVENDLIRRDLKDRFARERQSFTDIRQNIREDVSARQKDASIKQDEAFRTSKEALNTKSGITISDVTAEAKQSFEKSNIAIQEDLATSYEGTLAKYQMLQKQQGMAVDNAINEALNVNPLVTLPSKGVKKTVTDILSKRSPFVIRRFNTGQGPRFAKTADPKFIVMAGSAADSQADVKQFQSIIDEFTEFTGKEGQVQLGYLQRLKTGLHTLSSKHFAGKNKALGRFYQELSEAVNPVQYVGGTAKVSKDLAGIAKANETFSEAIPKYKLAISNYYKQNANGDYIPNMQKAMNAVSGNNPVVIGEMRIADSGLAPEDRILPKVRRAVSETATAQTKQVGIVKNIKQKVKIEKAALDKATRESKNKLAKEQRSLTIEKRNQLSKEIRDYDTAKKQELNAIEDKLNAELTKVEMQNDIRKFAAKSETGAGVVQRGLLMTGMGGLAASRFTTPAVGAAGLQAIGLSGAVSPVGSALIGKGLIGAGNITDQLLSPLKSKTFQQVTSRRIDEALNNRKKKAKSNNKKK